MIRSVITTVLCLASLMVSAQEFLSPLTRNTQLHKQELRTTLDGTYFYEEDTLTLPFIDDFSSDKFRKYTAQPGDANVSDTTWIFLWDQALTAPLVDTACFMLDTTYTITYDSVTVDSLAITYVPLPSGTISVYDSTTYPVSVSQVEVWPDYNVIITNWAGTTDTSYEPIPDICQDSMTLYFVSSIDPDAYWIDSYAYLNNHMSVDPPTVGVASFDGVDENGYPYDPSGLPTYAEADFLTTKPIDLSNTIDSVYLSFFYEPQGLGDNPEGEDSLVLEFWAPDSAKWFWRWSAVGTPLDSFHYVHLPIYEPQYLDTAFRFRFKNYATQSGMLDHWHVDYVFLDDLRFYDDTIMQDFAFQYPSSGLIEEYYAMPWKHFKWNPASYMKTVDTVQAYNGSNDPKFIGPGRLTIDYEGTVQGDFPYTVTTPNVNGFSQFDMVYEVNSAPNNFVFNDALNDTCASFTVTEALSTTTLPELLMDNDTVRYQQDFMNYYAYDDGTAEQGYGIAVAGGMVAYQFEVAQQDTLGHILMHWAPAAPLGTQETFWLTVWDDNNGQPGNVIHQSDDLPYHKPVYVDGPNGFGAYFFDNDDKPIVNGTYYIGWVQQDDDIINIGFDRNTNKQDRIFFNAGTGWINTSFEGALMMRPVFLSPKSVTGVDEFDQEAVILYPNPSNGDVFLRGANILGTEVYDVSGRRVEGIRYSGGQLNTSQLTPGVYVVRYLTEKGWGTKRFIRN